MSDRAAYAPPDQQIGSPPAPTPALAGLERTPDRGREADELIKLDRNERVESLPEWFAARVRESITAAVLTRYPTSYELYEELSAALGVERARLLLVPGSDAGIKAVYHAFLQPGDGVVALDPSYAMYPVYARMFQAQLFEVPIGYDLAVDGDRLLAAVKPGVRLVMLANPNQPTGTLIDEQLLVEVLERAGEVGALVAVDEAYYPFSSFTMLPRIEAYPQLLVLRTFSKAGGLAGLRVGFAAGHPAIVSSVAKVRTLSDVNAIAMLGVRELLRCPEIVSDYVSQVEQGQALLVQRVRELGLDPVPTAAGFTLVRTAARCEPKLLVEALARLGYLVKGPFSAPCISDCIRVTLGPAPLMSAFADSLSQALSELEGSEHRRDLV